MHPQENAIPGITRLLEIVDACKKKASNEIGLTVFVRSLIANPMAGAAFEQLMREHKTLIARGRADWPAHLQAL